MATPSPTDHFASSASLFAAYLDSFREELAETISAMPDESRRTSLVASGWTPLELAVHLTFVERRWLIWGFEGADVGDPWGDWRDGRWHVADDATTESVLAALLEQGAQTRRVLATAELAATGAPGPRWDGEAPPTLERICLHLVQEYARHLGHLDICAELVSSTET